MASKKIYPLVAVIGIAAASGIAWWMQNKPSPSNGGADGAVAAAPQGAASGAAGSSRGPGGPVTVEAARVEVMRLTDDSQTVGSLRSRRSVMVRPEVSGRITQLNFRDGDRIQKGQVLVQFDDQLPQAQVKQSLAELSIAQANHKRNQDLVAQNFISQRTVDESAANLEVAQAKLALARATADRLRIVAPFDGIAGIRTVNIGDYLKDGTDIVNIEDIDAVYVDFRLPERFQTKIRRGQRAVLDIDALPGRKFSAIVLAIDPLLDANGRSIGVRGCVDNRQLQLRPGMFARVTSVFGERENARVIPEEALVPQGNRQFVIKLVDGPTPETRSTQRVEVKVGIRRPGRVEITEGLEPGDQIVTAGQQRVQRDGSVVRVVDLNRRGGAGGPGGPGAGGQGGPAAAASAPASGPSGSMAPMAAGNAAGAAPGMASGQTPGAGERRGPGGPGAGNARNARAPEGPNPCLAEMAGGEGRGAQPGRGGAGGREGGPGRRPNPA
jgi:membrane fusion protein (multidrug efflux system)